MLITLIHGTDSGVAPVTLGVPEQHADAVISALEMAGWHLLSKSYAPPNGTIVDCLQAALFEVNRLPVDAPVRVAVERAVATMRALDVPENPESF